MSTPKQHHPSCPALLAWDIAGACNCAILRPVRLLVCGGRAYADAGAVDFMLDSFRKEREIEVIITGGAPGADALAAAWAVRNGVRSIVEEARWDGEGRAAGPKRNQRMIDLHRPTCLLAFPGGRGTEDMKRRARAAHVPIVVLARAAGLYAEYAASLK